MVLSLLSYWWIDARLLMLPIESSSWVPAGFRIPVRAITAGSETSAGAAAPSLRTVNSHDTGLLHRLPC